MEILYTVLISLACMLLGYLFGSVPTGVIIGRIHGIDIRAFGSGNTGGTNVGRTLGKKAGITTMVLDMLKAYVPLMIILLILSFSPIHQILVSYSHIDELLISLSAIAVLLGHTFPVFAHFKGGKAVSCIAGYILFVSPILFVVGIALFLVLFHFTRKISLCSVITVPCIFLLTFVAMILDFTVLKNPTDFNGGLYITSSYMLHLSYITPICSFLGASLVVYRHKSNIKRLEKGEEPDTHFENIVDRKD